MILTANLDVQVEDNGKTSHARVMGIVIEADSLKEATLKLGELVEASGREMSYGFPLDLEND